MEEFEDLCVVIVYYNGDMEVCKSVKLLSHFCKCIVVIDNGSNRNKDVIERIGHIESVKIIQNSNNEGIAYALNQGLDFAIKNEKEIMLTLDQDSKIEEEAIKKLISHLNKDRSVVSVGATYGTQTGASNRLVTNLITSGNMMFTDVAREIGGYNSSLFIDCVDIDFSFNLLEHGYKLLRCGDAKMEHEIGEIKTSRILNIPYNDHSPERYYYKYRNNIYIYRRYFRKFPLLCIKLFICLIKDTFQLLIFENNKKRKMQMVLKGIRDYKKVRINEG